jgi:hypothetical protein
MRPGALLLDGGDSWQGSATALWTKGQDMVDASKLLGVDVMTGHWEFTYGQARVKQVVDNDFKGKVEFLAQNVATTDFNDPVFSPYTLREINGVTIAIVGQAFPYTPIANPRHFVPEWTFGIQEVELQKRVDEARAKGAQAVVLLSHNGMDVDLKLATRVTGIDAILGGHTHDAVPQPLEVKNAAGMTLVTNAGSNGKFLGVLDLDVRGGKVQGIKYRLLPVFSNLLPADPAMQAYIDRVRAPHLAKLTQRLAIAGGTLYRRGNFNGTIDQVILDALMQVKGAEIAFSPGFRWGTSLLPGQAITTEQVMDWSGDHLSADHVERHHRRDGEDDPRGRLRQPLQSRPVLPARRRHGSGGWPHVHLHAGRGHGTADLGHAPEGRADRGRQDVQGGRLGAGRRGREGRADLGRHHAVPERQEDRQPAAPECAEAGRCRGKPGHCVGARSSRCWS